MSSFRTPESQTAPVRAVEVNTPTYKQVDAFLLVIVAPLLAPLSGFVTAWVADHFPGITVSASSTTDFMIAGVAAFVVLVLGLVHKQLGAAGLKLQELDHFVLGEVAQTPGLSDLEKLVADAVKGHAGQIEAAIESKLPPALSQALQAFLKETGLQVNLTPPAPAPAPAQAPTPIVGVSGTETGAAAEADADAPTPTAAPAAPPAPGTPGAVS